MEPYRVFISSIMNRSIEDLLGERETARSAVDHFAPITTPWAFEAHFASIRTWEWRESMARETWPAMLMTTSPAPDSD